MNSQLKLNLLIISVRRLKLYYLILRTNSSLINSNRNSNRQDEMGITVLESSLALVILVLCILGTVNLANVNRAHNAAQSAVEAALRCLTPLAGECRGATNSAGGFKRFYDLYQTLDNNSESVLVREATYQANSSSVLLQSPTYKVTNTSAKVLAKRFDEVYDYSLKRKWVQAEGALNYVVRQLPQVYFRKTGIAQGGFIIHAGSYRDATDLRFISWPGAVISGTFDTRQSARYGTPQIVNFNIPSATLGIPLQASECFIKQLSPSPSTTADCTSWGFTRSTSSIDPASINLDLQRTRYSYGLLSVSGELSSGGSGSVSLYIEWQDPTTLIWSKRSLGGMSFSNVAAGTKLEFIPRGAPLNNYTNYGSYLEPTLHQGILMPLNSTFRVGVVSEKSGITYKVTSARIFPPHYSPHITRLPCSYPILQTQLASTPSMSCPARITMALHGIDKSVSISALTSQSVTEERNRLGCLRDDSSAKSKAEKLLNTQGIPSPLPPEYFIEKDSASRACDTITKVSVCPSNFGTVETAILNTSLGLQLITNSPTANQLCPESGSGIIEQLVQSSANTSTPLPPKPFWSENSIALPNINEELTPTIGCASPCSPGWIPQSLRQYKKPSFTCEPTTRLVTISAPQNSSWYQVTNNQLSPEYNLCRRLVINDSSIQSSIDQALQAAGLKGPLPDLGCSWRDKLNAPLPKTFPLPTDIQLSQTWTGKEIATDISETIPDQCTYFRQSKSAQQERQLFAQRVPEEEVTIRCAAAQGPCYSELVATEASSPSPSPPLVNFEKAKQVAISTAKVSLPELGNRFPIDHIEIVEPSPGEYQPRLDIAVPILPFSGKFYHISYEAKGLSEWGLAQRGGGKISP